MVIVDTSVWILCNREPYGRELDRLLSLDQVASHELVYGELPIGDRGGRGKLLDANEQMHQATIVRHEEVVAFVRDRDLHERGVGRIVIHLLASAIVGKFQLWTADLRFAARAEEFRVDYLPRPASRCAESGQRRFPGALSHVSPPS